MGTRSRRQLSSWHSINCIVASRKGQHQGNSKAAQQAKRNDLHLQGVRSVTELNEAGDSLLNTRSEQVILDQDLPDSCGSSCRQGLAQITTEKCEMVYEIENLVFGMLEINFIIRIVLVYDAVPLP